MPFTSCLGCSNQKRNKSTTFYLTNNIPDALTSINNIRKKYNTKRKSLDDIDQIPPDSKICKSCYDQVIRNPLISIDHDTPRLDIYREGHNSHTNCTFGCKQTTWLISVPKHVRQLLLMEYKFLILDNARMCRQHIGIDNYWPLVNQISNEVPDNRQKIVSNLMHQYYHDGPKSKKRVFDIDKIDSINENDFKAWFGIDKNQFNEICSYSPQTNPTHVAILLCKLRTSLTNQQLGFLFGICERTVANHMNSATKDLIENFVPNLINFHTRETLIGHNTIIAKVLFDVSDNKGCVIFDATYRLCQKSKNFAGQKNLWSEQKKFPLVKPMVGCTPDGYILFVMGPYDATHNDAKILEDCFQRFEDQLSIIHEGDLIFVDRGFRDVLPYLIDNKKFKVHMPGMGDLETFDANMSRFVTKIRWIIEQVFGRLKKKFKHFAIPAHNSTLEHDIDQLLIGFSILNVTHRPILSDGDDENIAHLMLSRLNVENKLKKIVEEFNLTRVTVPYIEVQYTRYDNTENNALLRFPALTENDLYYVSFGSYQIENARSYFAQHVKEEIFLVHKFEPPHRHSTSAIKYSEYDVTIEDPLLVKAYMKSRYRNAKNHHIFVLVDRSKSGRDSITEHYCTCECGSRTVGCCSHVMAIIWYLGYGQYHQIKIPNQDICDVSITISKDIMEVE